MKVALSVTESECIVLSQITRDLIPIRNMIEYLNAFTKVDNMQISACSTLFKNNLEQNMNS